MTLDEATLRWMIETDPALAWQVERDLVHVPEQQWQATRARVATEGLGARLLALQDEDGQWAGGAYFPGRADPRAVNHPDDDQGQPWTATTWSLHDLREWGLDASVLTGTHEKLAAHSRWEYDDLPYWGGEVDCCINAYTLANGVWLGADVTGLVDWFLAHQLEDGGWNCAWVDGSTRSSFHSTLNAVRGLLWYERAVGGHDELHGARHRAQEYLLERRLRRRATTGELVGSWVDDLAYPFRWRYSSLRALDHLREAALHDRDQGGGDHRDPRAAEAVEVLRSARGQDGRWVQGTRLPGQVWFEVDVPVGEPSPWVTFHAARVLAWWDGPSPSTTQ